MNLVARARFTWLLHPQRQPRSTDTGGQSHTPRHVPSPWQSTAARDGKEMPSEAMVTQHGSRGRREEGAHGLGKIDGLVAIKKKISRWRLSY